MHCGYVVKVEQLRKHTNADKLQIATFFGNDTIVDLSVKCGDMGVYFPVDLQLSEEYCEHNNLVRKKDDAGNNIGGFLDPDKRNIKAIKLRGEKSDGLFMPLDSFCYCWDLDIEAIPEGCEITVPLGIGDQVTILNGHEICTKYIPRRQSRVGSYSNGNKTRKHRVPVAPLFSEHVDTEQLAYNLGAFKSGDEIEITLKMHGTSQRTGYLPTLKCYKKTLWDKLTKKIGKPVYDWGYVSGTRRTVLEDYNGGYYGSNEFREQHSKVFEGKLMKGETVYYEVVGFTNTGAPIMASASNTKINDKEFVKQYGKETVFSYGCSPDGIKMLYGEDAISTYAMEEAAPKSDLYVYRMTMTNEDGFVIDYTPDFMRYRCEQIGVKTVPVMWKGIIPESDEERESFVPSEESMVPELVILTPGEWIKAVAEDYYDGPDPIGKTHIREGAVVRIINRPKFCAYKHKNFSFKVLEGHIKDTADAPDMEEAQEVTEV